MLSVILPTNNELGLVYLPRILDRVSAVASVELICVDNASTDGTESLLADYAAKPNVQCVTLPDSNRAQRLNAGVRAANNDRVLLHHPRSLLDAGALEALMAVDVSVTWGGFTHSFDSAHDLLAWTSYYSNRIRMDRSGIVYLDHCIFFDRRLLGETPVPELDIFEDTALSQALLAHGKPLRLPQLAVTSAVRYGKNGVWRQAAMNQVLKVGYKLGIDHQRMNAIYERGLRLNNTDPAQDGATR